MLNTGRYASIDEIAAAEKIDRGHAGCILCLTLLAPDSIEAILVSHHKRVTEPQNVTFYL